MKDSRLQFIKPIKALFYLGIMILFIACGITKTIVDRDGSSFEKAVLVNNIQEEYIYVRKNCEGCTVMGQALTYNKKIPFDILTCKKPDGQEVSYYFDISKFFGKW